MQAQYFRPLFSAASQHSNQLSQAVSTVLGLTLVMALSWRTRATHLLEDNGSTRKQSENLAER